MWHELNAAVTAALETGLNSVLRLDPDSMARLDQLQGKVIALELRGLNQTFYLLPSAQGIMVQGHYEGEPDATLSGTPLSLAELSLGSHSNRVLFRGDVRISGDIKLGQDFKRILDGLDIDWEELLSQYTGDVLAHKLGHALRQTRDWGRNAVQTLGQNAAEYLQQESFDLPPQDEVAPFIKEVDQLRDDMERLAQRVARLQGRLSETKSS